MTEKEYEATIYGARVGELHVRTLGDEVRIRVEDETVYASIWLTPARARKLVTALSHAAAVTERGAS